MNNIPFFGITISLFKNNKIILGVIYLPYLKELFHAEKGKGAYLNGKKVKVSNKNNLSKSIFAAPSATCYVGSKSIIKLHKIFQNEVQARGQKKGDWEKCERDLAAFITK